MKNYNGISYMKDVPYQWELSFNTKGKGEYVLLRTNIDIFSNEGLENPQWQEGHPATSLTACFMAAKNTNTYHWAAISRHGRVIKIFKCNTLTLSQIITSGMSDLNNGGFLTINKVSDGLTTWKKFDL